MSLSAHAAAGMVMGGVWGPSPGFFDSEGGAFAELLAAYAEAGVKSFLFPGSLAREPERLARLVRAARASAERAGLGRALVAIGGEARPGFGLPFLPQAPAPLGLASLGSAAAARRAGRLVGARLAACGVDLALGPRLDLASDPKAPAGALDGFGEDARLAAALGAAFARGLAREGVAACVGRFPGLGATCSDCYEGMAFVALPAERLERCEMRPFMRASAAGVAAVLVGRVLVPALESGRIPASASARVIEGRLREGMRFGGLVIGDDVGEDEDAGRAAILGALAGCDLGLFSRPDDARRAAAALEKAAEAGELPCIRVETARRRFERLAKRRADRAPERFRGGGGAERAALRDIEGAVSRLRGDLVLDAAAGGDFASVLVVAFLPPEDAPDAAESEGVVAAVRKELPGAAALTFPAVPGPADAEELAASLAEGGRFAEAVILTYDAHFRPAQESLAKLVEESLPRFRVIAMRDPYDAAFFPQAVGLGAAYGFSASRAGAAARALAGRAKPRGGQPVEVIGLEI